MIDAQTNARAPILAIDDLAPGADDGPLPDRRPAAQDDVRLDGDVRRERHVPVEVDRGRVAHRDPVAHVLLVAADPQAPLGGGELRAVVDAIESTVVLEGDRGDESAVLAGEADELGQVQLAGRGRGRQRLDAAAQPGGIEDVEARVDLVVVELVLAGVLELDDRLDDAELAADDAPELGRVGGDDRGQRDGGVVLAARLEDGLEVGGRDERHVAGQDEDLGGVLGDGLHGRADRVAGAAWLVLEGELGSVGEALADGLDRRGVDDDRVRGASRRRPRRPHPRRRARRRASAGRTAGAGPWGAPTSCACRVPPRGPRRWFGRLAQAWARDLEGSCAAPGVRGAVLARAACGARRAEKECHQVERGWYGRPAETVKRAASTTAARSPRLSIKPPFGRAPTANVERAGGGSGMNLA